MNTMSATPTQGESEADNSSSANNISSLVAEKGTAAGSRDVEEEFDESSIEALNWSEADEEELLLQHTKRVKTKSPTVVAKHKNGEHAIEGELAAASLDNSITSEGEEGTVRMLSSSLLQSIASTADGSDSRSSKNQVIESWASDVKEAVDRGELEVQDADDEEENKENVEQARGGVRKRKRKDEMTASMTSCVTSESGPDPLSNAPVLDEGPIWNKGPKRYRFEENRRVNQKLTFGVLIAVVLAVGLGLGNLVAYNECETEFKASLVKEQPKPDHNPPAPETPSTPEVSKPSTMDSPPPKQEMKKEEKVQEKPDIELDREQYTMQMHTLSKIVKTLDNIQKRIDKFENHTRQLGGVVLLKQQEDPEDEDVLTSTTPSPTASTKNPSDRRHVYDSILEETVHPDVDSKDSDDEVSIAEEEESEREAFILDLIDGIEETPAYLNMQEELEYLQELEKGIRRPKIFDDPDPPPKSPEEMSAIRTAEAAFTIMKKSHEEFIRKERDELRERKILGLAEERMAEDYSPEEKAEIKQKYDKFMAEYPFKEEVEIEKERLKFAKEPEQDDETSLDLDIDDFFKRHYGSEEDSVDDFDFSSFAMDPQESPSQEDVVPTSVEVGQDSPPGLNNFERISTSAEIGNDNSGKNSNEKVNSDEATVDSAQDNWQSKTSDENSFDSGRKHKKSRKGRHSKEESSNESGSGSGSRFKDKKKYSKKENKDKGRNKWDQPNEKPPKGKFKGYDLNNVDMDDDDDDHKRKRYHSRSGEDHYHQSHRSHPNGGRQSQEDTNWLLERDKAREDYRKDYGSKMRSQQNQHSSSGKKAHNWQFVRDRVREKVRTKNEKNKSFDYK